MSDNLLERLETLGRGLGRQFIIYNEAAEEITRLRAENETLRRDVRTAVMGDSAELQDVKRENERLHRETAIRIDQIEREQEAHLKTMADLNKQAEMNGRLLTENAELREALKTVCLGVVAERENLDWFIMDGAALRVARAAIRDTE